MPAKPLPVDDVIKRMWDHIERHKDRPQAPVSTEGLRALLVEIKRLRRPLLPVEFQWLPYPTENKHQVLNDVLVVGSVERFYDDAPCYGAAFGMRLGAISTDTAARDAVIAAVRGTLATSLSACVVADGEGKRFRKWGDFGPEWTEDRNEALWFARREDAERFCVDDEDAWRILPAVPDEEAA